MGITSLADYDRHVRKLRSPNAGNKQFIFVVWVMYAITQGGDS